MIDEFDLREACAPIASADASCGGEDLLQERRRAGHVSAAFAIHDSHGFVAQLQLAIAGGLEATNARIANLPAKW